MNRIAVMDAMGRERHRSEEISMRLGGILKLHRTGT